jgi:hypothetical protein
MRISFFLELLCWNDVFPLSGYIPFRDVFHVCFSLRVEVIFMGITITSCNINGNSRQYAWYTPIFNCGTFLCCRLWWYICVFDTRTENYIFRSFIKGRWIMEKIA